MRAQPQVDVEDPLLPRHHEARQLLHRLLAEAPGVVARRQQRPGRLVHEDELEVGGVAQLAPAELAEAERRHRPVRAVGRGGHSQAARLLFEARP